DVIAGRTNVSPSHPKFADQLHEKYDFQWNRCTDAVLNDPEIEEMYYRYLRSAMDKVLAGTYYEDRIDALSPLMVNEHALDIAAWSQYGTIQTLATAVADIKNNYLNVRRTHLFTTHQVANEIPPAQTPGLPVVITEMMYNPIGGTSLEFLELFNPSATEAIDLSGWTVEGLALTIPDGTVILPMSYAVLAKDDPLFRATYGSGHFVPSTYDGRLNNSGETIVLRDRSGGVIDNVTYFATGPWSETANGGGTSLEVIDPLADNNNPFNWASSLGVGGSPGATNTVDGGAPPEVRINEIQSVNSTTILDELGEAEPWIEIYNAEPLAVDLSGMWLSNDAGTLDLWQIPPATTLCGRCFLQIWGDGETADGPLHTNFVVSAAGGTIHLSDASVVELDSLSYGVLAADLSTGRLPDGTFILKDFQLATPALPNQPDPTPIILNEYNAVSDSKFLKNGNSDIFWGRILGNGGDWFELVIVQDHLDIRGWKFEVVDDAGGPGENVDLLELSNDPLWSDLRSGTIITVSEVLPTDVSYDPVNQDWWINVRAANSADGVYITADNFPVSNDNWNLTILDASDQTVYGPVGEGINPIAGVGSDEVFKLEEDSHDLITPLSEYNDGTSSTFGQPNVFAAGTVTQDFSVLRGCGSDADCDDTLFCNGLETCVGLVCVPGTPVAIDDGVSCTDDACDEATDSVLHVANDAVCDDAVFCNGAETCDAVLDCQVGTPPVVDDGVGCTDDSCDEVNDVIVHAVNNANCDDALFCNGAESCDALLDCQVGTPPVISDGVACTVDSCDEASDNVIHIPSNALCDNGQFCDGAE
ncbi:MAG: lamin tail domain-containing protein, partial [Acidobacteria bacterium]|nr:lamin tail domain-containing protein [Acidobacteriota bacterium]